jgi:uncharacterized membrane protein YgdD (TMEM256/DUF423 family)
MVGVAADALGAHLLRATLSDAAMESYATGVRYLMLHAVLLLACGLQSTRTRAGWPWQLSLWGMLAGVCLFSGGLMLWTTQGWTWAQACAPWGGSLLILSWLGLALSALLAWNHRPHGAVGSPNHSTVGLPRGSIES